MPVQTVGRYTCGCCNGGLRVVEFVVNVRESEESTNPPGSDWALGWASVVVRLSRIGEGSLLGWQPGPMPFELPSGHSAAVTDQDARSTYFSPRVARVLYGRRFHRSTVWKEGNSRGIGSELLEITVGSTELHYLVLHFDLPRPAPLLAIQELSTVARGDNVSFARQVPAGYEVFSRHSRPFVCSHLVPTQALPDPGMSDRYQVWPPATRWLWLAASATPEQAFPPDPEDTSLLAAIHPLSADWRTMILRDGAAFLGLTSYGASTYHNDAAVIVRSIYLDALLLGIAQKDAIYSHADELSQLSIGGDVAGGLRRLERSLTALRNEIWWQSLSHHHVCNRLIQGYHDHFNLPSLMAQIVADHGDWHRIVSEERDRRTGASLGILSLVAAPFAVCYTAAVTVAAPSERTFAAATFASLAVVVVLLLVVQLVQRRGEG